MTGECDDVDDGGECPPRQFTAPNSYAFGEDRQRAGVFKSGIPRSNGCHHYAIAVGPP
jgi:hypothetical protein